MRFLALACSLLLAPSLVLAADSRPRPPVWKTLAPFKSVEEFNDYRHRVREAARANRQNWGSTASNGARPLLAQVAEPCDPAVEECFDQAISESLESVVVTGVRASKQAAVSVSRSADVASAESITNNQEAGVDEGDIVKAWDRFLVVLMHGRLFSVDTANSAAGMRLVDRIDSYQNARDEDWIDEMLITGDKIIVTGYSYRTSTSNYSVFRIDREGRLSFLARFSVESEDYYSGENYASRIVDGKLVLYMPFNLTELGQKKDIPLPRIRRWTEQQGHGEWQPLFEITDVYRPIQPTYWPALHVLTFCDLESRAAKPCKAKGIVGPWGRETYVTPDNYYLWLTTDADEYRETQQREECEEGRDHFHKRGHPSAVYRLTLSRHSLTAAHTEGWPSDQFSLEERDGDLWALVRRPPATCQEREDDESGFPMALAKVPQENFSPRPDPLHSNAYFRVPRVHNRWSYQTRFSRNHVMYGSAPGYWRRASDDANSQRLIVVPLASPMRAHELTLPHSVTRIELFGDHAMTFGYLPGSDFGVSSVALRRKPRIADTQVMPGIVESEGRSHAFNARVEDDDSGLFGLPTMDVAQPHGFWHERPVDVQFFTATADLQLDSASHLAGEPRNARESTSYQCQVSCYDWYGNARPIFFRGRIFALIGLELIEGQLINGRIGETARVNLASVPVNRRP
jgi:hypothetical protein